MQSILVVDDKYVDLKKYVVGGLKSNLRVGSGGKE